MCVASEPILATHMVERQWLIPKDVLPSLEKACRGDSRLAPSQWETALLRNDVSHWLGASLESVLKACGHKVGREVILGVVTVSWMSTADDDKTVEPPLAVVQSVNGLFWPNVHERIVSFASQHFLKGTLYSTFIITCQFHLLSSINLHSSTPNASGFSAEYIPWSRYLGHG